VKALLSGQAGMAVVVGRKPWVRTAQLTTLEVRHEAEALRFFDGCADVRALTVESIEELDLAISRAWRSDRALRICLFLLDPEEDESELREYAECLEGMFSECEVRDSVENNLYSAPLPIELRDQAIQRACADFRQVYDMYTKLILAQGTIQKVRLAFDNLPAANFSTSADKVELRWKLIESGAFRDVVKGLDEKLDLNFIKLAALSKNREHADSISQWLGSLQGGLKRVARSMIHEVDPEFDDEFEDETRGSNGGVFDQIKLQQTAIVSKLKDRDLDGARWLMNALVASQRTNSTNEQLGMTLCSMAQKAKLHEIPQLQFEWAKQAVEESPRDPETFGHYADALISLGNYSEANAAFDNAEAAGEPLFAATGRARILRAMGRPVEARAAFLAAISEFEGFPGVEHAVMGAAQALRDLGELEAAADEYRQITETSPLNSLAWAGLAYALMDLGRLTEAMSVFGKVAANDRNSTGKIGRANTLKLKGAFDEAIGVYRQVIDAVPNNHLAWCGIAETLHLQGKDQEALAAYDEAVTRSPHFVAPLIGKGNLLRVLGRFEQANSVFEDGAIRFPYDRRVSVGLANVLRSRGQYAEALVRYEKLHAEFPFDSQINIYRALTLMKLGSFEASIDLYDQILSVRPNLGRARTGKASILLQMERYEEAAKMLPFGKPQSQNDWRHLLLRAHLLEKTAGFEDAAKELRFGIKNCPFYQIRGNFRDALVSLELRRDRRPYAEKVMLEAPNEVSNIIAFHVFLANQRLPEARARLDRIRSTEGPAIIIELADELARRHNLVNASPQRERGWMWRVERNWILDEAA
jgi:tetratricopeptide (TPR) repeat protein